MNIDKLKQENPEKLNSMVNAGIHEFSAKPFRDANTDVIVADCKISKGLLFHYFGSKKVFYLYCLDCALSRLVTESETDGKDFYDVLFHNMKDKLRVCHEFPEETSFVNLASRESAQDITPDIKSVVAKYRMQLSASSMKTISYALSKLDIKESCKKDVTNGLLLYTSAILNQYLIRYQTKPEDFFAHANEIQEELRSYIDMFLYGIAKEETL